MRAWNSSFKYSIHDHRVRTLDPVGSPSDVGTTSDARAQMGVACALDITGCTGRDTFVASGRSANHVVWFHSRMTLVTDKAWCDGALIDNNYCFDRGRNRAGQVRVCKMCE